MNLIQFLPNESNGAGCPKATAPVVTQGDLTIPAGSGATPLNLLPAIASGSPAAFAGQVVNQGCHNVLLSITYLDGDDCDDCTTPDTLTPVVVDVTVPKNSAFPLPAGFITLIQATALDSAGVAVNVQVDVELDYYSAYQPCCAGGVLVP